jgi:ribosomal-protein-serine acetyltransferase
VNPISWPIDGEAVIRTYTPDDADTVFSAVEAERERLSPWMPWVRTTRTSADTRAFIERSLASEHDLEGNGIWVGDAYAGSIGLSVHTLSGSGEIGYWLVGRFEGRGLVTRACRLFIDHGFEALGLHRISIHAAVGNARSRAVAERLGFTQEGILREADLVGDGDRYVDLVVYGLLASEWSIQ